MFQWIYLSDYLLPQRWQSIIQNRTMFDLVEVITWNDYGESHYVGPIAGAQPNRCLAITMRCTSLVPSPISQILASRR